jgi:hypothetical protein
MTNTLFTLDGGAEQVFWQTNSGGAEGPDTVQVFGEDTGGSAFLLASDGIVDTAAGWVQGTSGGASGSWTLDTLNESAVSLGVGGTAPVFTIEAAFSQTAAGGAGFSQTSFADLDATTGTTYGTVELAKASVTANLSVSGISAGESVTTSAQFTSLGGYLNVSLDLGGAVSDTYQNGSLIASTSSYALFATNGTAAGTHQLLGGNGVILGAMFGGIGGYGLFYYENATTSHLESDLSSTGVLTTLATVTAPTAFSSLYADTQLGRDFILATSGSTEGLYASDGTAGGTVSLFSGVGAITYLGTSLGRDLFKFAGASSFQVYVSDGTAAGSKLVTSAPNGDTVQVTADLLKTTVTIKNATGGIVSRTWIDGATEKVGAAGDEYVWSGPVSASWDASGNWTDTTTGADPAGVAPRSNDSVTIAAAAAGATQVIAGTGNSTYLTINGNTLLDGQFSTGALAVSSAGGGTLSLQAGGQLNISGDANLFFPRGLDDENYQSLQIAGGALTVGGALNVGVSSNFSDSLGSVIVSNGGTVRAGRLNVTYSSYVQVDSTSTFEIGTMGGVAAGSFTVDAGETISNSYGSAILAPTIVNNGVIQGSSGDLEATTIINNGTITNQNLSGLSFSSATVTNNGTITLSQNSITGTVIDNGDIIANADYNFADTLGTVTGGGQIQIGSGAILSTGQVASTITLSFAGSSGSFDLSASSLDASHVYDPTLIGFGATDVIDYAGTITTISYSSGAGNLTLLDGSATVATLHLKGNYGSFESRVGYAA